MSNTWHMNRMGFVNFWLYDEEIFSFQDGKLLLRGQNGSGKSITTQSFIPFILDGDRSPSRLDPFGSSDRRMEYYFLGENDREEATGYLFLEFKRENIEQYRTIGIGQRAQKGKPMAFWGFLILDGRRIGYDLSLYREAGTKKIPYSKQELRQVLGEENPLTEVQRDYMELVNKHLFGFSGTEQYNQFIKLLIKVRAPKLSKEFKPSRVYEILNDSLQTLTDEDLRAMVEAMERMDEIQGKLDHLKDAYKDLNAIRNEYNRYNGYMLGKKAQSYLEEKKRVDEVRGRLDARQQELEDSTAEIKERRQRATRIQDEMHVLEAEKDTLHLEDLEDSMDRLKKAEAEKTAAEKEKEQIEARIEHCREQILQKDQELRACQGKIEDFLQQQKKAVEELDVENETALFPLHDQVRLLVEARDTSQAVALKRELRNLQQEIQKGCEAQHKLKELQLKWDREEEALQKLLQEKEEIASQCQSAEQMEDECRDRLVETVHALTAQNREMTLSANEREELLQQIRRYQGPAQLGEILDAYYRIWSGKNRILEGRRLQKEQERSQSLMERNRLREELAQIEAMVMPEPARRERTKKARAALKEQGISFVPFYEAVEFAEGLPQEERDRLEGQLEAAGLLDALIVPAEECKRAKAVLQGLSDVLLAPYGAKGEPFPHLVCVLEESGLRKAAQELLACMREKKAQDSVMPGQIVLSPDGYFQNGILEGYCHSEEEASYVGAAARRRKKERMRRQKQEELRCAEERLQALDQELAALKERLQILLQERENFPAFTDLDHAMDLLAAYQKQLEQCSRQLQEQEAAAARLKDAVKMQEQQMLKLCKALPYYRTPEAYEEAKASVQSYGDLLDELEGARTAWETKQVQAAHIRELTEREREVQENEFDYLRRAERNIKELQVRMQRIREYLEDPQIQQKVRRLAAIKEELEQKATQHHENDKRLAILVSNEERLAAEIGELKQAAIEQIAKETKLREYFSEELALGLVMKQEGTDLLQAAQSAGNQLREMDRHRSGSEMTTALMKTFHAHMGSISGYGITMEECFTGGGADTSLLRARQRIAAIWNGKKLYLEEFYTIIREAIENTELLIRTKDRELFEGILADTLSRKLSSRIRESRSWIKDMSALMKQMDTSMALTFSLEWKPKAAEGDQELDTRELEKILARERELLTAEDIEKVSVHFRTRIHNAKRMAQENGDSVNYMDLVRDALDYRKWFEFCMYYYRNEDNKKELTNGAFNRFSGGEKAMAMYVPLFAAVNAQYKKAEHEDHPRMIALDEAFAGVDDKNISSMFELVEKLDFDYIMNSQVLWGCYETVKKLRIAELLRPANSDLVTVIYYSWNGHERVLDAQ